MEYSKARRIRKTGLFKLIAEKKFEEGQGLGSAIGGAISDKFKAKSMGFEEALDPSLLAHVPFDELDHAVGRGDGRVLGDLADDDLVLLEEDDGGRDAVAGGVSAGYRGDERQAERAVRGDGEHGVPVRAVREFWHGVV
mgnify:CR=1 FL=1